MSSRTVALSSKELDSAIEVLSSAKTLQLTRFEKISYRALIFSVDVAAACYIADNAWNSYFEIHQFDEWSFSLVVGLLFLLALLVGLVALALNTPLFLRAFRERMRLEELGLSSLTKSLWKESRRSRWISRIRGTLLMVIAVIFVFRLLRTAFEFYFFPHVDYPKGTIAAVIIMTAIALVALCLGARYLQIQRERMDLTANAEELRKAFQSLRQHAGKNKAVTVPSELLEQTAKIESARIAEKRKDAILESVSSRPTGYAIAFDRDAAGQRATLDVADRIELADLVAQLSIAGMQLEQREGMQRDKTQNNRVEIDYVIDNASRSIRVTAVRRVREVSDASVSGASHA